jgi:hypothetical protein
MVRALIDWFNAFEHTIMFEVESIKKSSTLGFAFSIEDFV